MKVETLEHHEMDSINVLEVKTEKLENIYNETKLETNTNYVIRYIQQKQTDYQCNTLKMGNEYTATAIKIECKDEFVETKSENEQFRSVIEPTGNTFNDNLVPTTYAQFFPTNVIERDVIKREFNTSKEEETDIAKSVSMETHISPNGNLDDSCSIGGQLKQEFDTSGKRLLHCTWANCNKVFRHLRSMEYHIRAHKNEKPFKCSTCERCFRGKGNLRKHAIIHNLSEFDRPGKRVLPCTWGNCSKVFEQPRSLEYHIRSHKNEKPFKCSTCERCFRSKENLRKHSIIHDLSPRPKFACTFENCNSEFLRLSSFKYHLLIHNNEKPFKCTLCDTSFRGTHILKKHMWSIHNKQQSTFNCHRCSAVFKTELLLGKHLRNQHQEPVKLDPQTLILESQKRYKCEACDKTFTKQYNLIQHCATQHTEVKPFGCLQCDKNFATQAYLRKHIKRYHPILAMEELEKKITNRQLEITDNYESTKKNVCEYCGKRFLRFCDLQRHRTLHTGELPFECSKCRRKYRGRDSLNRHSKTCDGQEVAHQVNYYVCDKAGCGKRFFNHTDFIAHTTVHMNEYRYQCSLNSNNTREYSYLMGHIETHSLLQTQTSDASKILANNKTESKIKPIAFNLKIEDDSKNRYSYQECDLGFSSSKKLKIHESLPHNLKPSDIRIESTTKLQENSTTKCKNGTMDTFYLAQTIKIEKEDPDETSFPPVPYNVCYDVSICKEEVILND